MAKLVDAEDLKSSDASRAGSIPAPGTKRRIDALAGPLHRAREPIRRKAHPIVTLVTRRQSRTGYFARKRW